MKWEAAMRLSTFLMIGALSGLMLSDGTQIGSSNTNGGWLLGAGIEYAFMPQWSAKLEYDYLGLNTWNVNSTPFAPNVDQFSLNRNIQAVTVGLNFKF
jgi:outer membrane immunogenic protein